KEVSLASLESVATLDPRVPETVLHDVSFTVAQGELVAVVGPSGAGKTTISQLVSRMYDARSGAVRVGGLDVRDVTLASLRGAAGGAGRLGPVGAAAGVATQDAHVSHDTTGATRASAGPDATDAAMWEALDAAQIGALVRSLPDGLDTVVGDRGYRLSGGEKQ